MVAQLREDNRDVKSRLERLESLYLAMKNARVEVANHLQLADDEALASCKERAVSEPGYRESLVIDWI